MAGSAQYTHGHHESVLRSHAWRTVANSAAYVSPWLVPGTEVLDVGCGPGTITTEMASLVSPARVVGVDDADVVLAGAREHAAAAGVRNVEFRAGDAFGLEFAGASFHVVHAHQVLQHVPDPVAVLGEMARVCRPDGVVAARDSDYSGMFWFPQIPELDEWLRLYRTLARHNGGEPDAGRRLKSWARAAGLDEVTASASVWCFAEDADRQWWAAMWADRVRESSFAHQAVEQGLATVADLTRIADGWRAWAEHDDGWFMVPHGEIVAAVG
ncbi:ubiquinone/menaquinone biosynthesis C-methylase UbiE [Haloactinopolyspora alba]|uniref:Ubiquinone/menaquinone biosynthesis C-methylase UbiE n=1 Tax=Haloactinopolyspora alba TaxID=648780 RepID=A0A2P8E085_9ACTN|nr:methyltransferase domain-containing protein [Haloactinopolyspora alba]PSL02859.1 ubiquinone/menaquinone biosynthesis C-methylase UbiE [Haloactinopolyspora alba]